MSESFLDATAGDVDADGGPPITSPFNQRVMCAPTMAGALDVGVAPFGSE